jgi:hypothetical protein
MQIISSRDGARSKLVAEPDEWLLNQIVAAVLTEGCEIPRPNLKVVKGRTKGHYKSILRSVYHHKGMRIRREADRHIEGKT